MTMTIKRQEQFDALVQQIEKYARRQPAQYRLRVGLLAALGYAYIFFVLALLLGMVWALRQAVVSTNSTDLIDQVNLVTFLVGLGLVRLFWVSFPTPKGLPLNSKQAPQLFALIDDLTLALETPKFDYIILTDEHNAGVLQVPRLGFLGWQKNYLLLGLPLMQSLSPEQFRAVIAHELGHLSGNHSRFAGWIYRVRNIWFYLAEQGDSFLFKWFFNWYEPFFKAYSFVLARADEYEADRCAAQMGGIQNQAGALINIAINSHFLQECFWPKVYKQTVHLEEPPDGTITNLLHELQKGVASEQAANWLDLALAEKTENDDTHPCLSERLYALGYQASLDQRPAPVQQTAAQHFFGEALESFAAHLDDHWKKDIAKSWKYQYVRTQYQKQNLDALSKKAHNHSLTTEEAWKRAYLTGKFKGNQAAIPLFQEVLRQQPEHPLANYQLGQVLLERNDDSGVNYLKAAIEADPSLVIASCERLYGFYKHQGQLEEAQVYLQRAQQHYDVWKKGVQERSRLNYHDQFKFHNLPEAEVKQIAEQLSGFPEIREAYLVRKNVTFFPEKPFYVLGIVRRFVSGSGPNYKPDEQLIGQLEAELNFSGEVYVIILPNMKLRNALPTVKGACIYRY